METMQLEVEWLLIINFFSINIHMYLLEKFGWLNLYALPSSDCGKWQKGISLQEHMCPFLKGIYPKSSYNACRLCSEPYSRRCLKYYKNSLVRLQEIFCKPLGVRDFDSLFSSEVVFRHTDAKRDKHLKITKVPDWLFVAEIEGFVSSESVVEICRQLG